MHRLRSTALVIASLLLLAGARAQDAPSDEPPNPLRALLKPALRRLQSRTLESVSPEDRAALQDMLGCDADDLPDAFAELTLRVLDEQGSLAATAAEVAAMREGIFDDAGNRRRFEARAEFLEDFEDLDISLPASIAWLLAEHRADRLQDGAEREIAWRLLDMPVRNLAALGKDPSEPAESAVDAPTIPTMPPTRGSNESDAISTLRVTLTCQFLFRDSDADGNGQRTSRGR